MCAIRINVFAVSFSFVINYLRCGLIYHGEILEEKLMVVGFEPSSRTTPSESFQYSSWWTFEGTFFWFTFLTKFLRIRPNLYYSIQIVCNSSVRMFFFFFTIGKNYFVFRFIFYLRKYYLLWKKYFVFVFPSFFKFSVYFVFYLVYVIFLLFYF